MSSKEKDTENSNEKLNQEILEIEKKVNSSKPQNDKEAEDDKTKNEKKIVKPKVENKVAPKEEESQEESIKSRMESNKKTWKLMIILIVFLIILVFSTIFALMNLGKNTIAKGVSIDEIDVSNLTVEEATNKLNEAANIKLMLGMDLVYGEDYNVEFDPNQIQYTYNSTNAVKEAYNIGKDKNIVLNNYTLLWVAFFGENLSTEETYNEESLNGIMDDIASKIPGLVVQASYYMENDQLIIDKGQEGVELNKEEVKKDIIENMKKRDALEIINSNENEVIEIKVTDVKPDPIDLQKIYEEVHKEPQDAYYVTEPFQIFKEQNGVDFAISMEEAQAIIADENAEEYTIPLKITPASKTVDDIGTEAFPYLISSYTTKYDASNANRSGNLRIAAEKINGTVLMPGEEFSFNEVVGKRTVEDGYRDAKIYSNGQVVDGLAGGICQISSTLYNAVLLANLEVTERRNHSFTSTYVPAGRDATVVYGTQDFKFKNTRTYPIKIEANVANGIAEFKIHGIKEEVEYDIRIIPVTTQTVPYTTEYVTDPTLAPGQQVIVQAGHSGYKVTTYIERRLSGLVASKDVLSNDTYNAMKAIVHIGP